MDLSGRTNIDLTEAARLMKQPTTSPTVNNPGQMQPPPLMMMQQAVAMQQFQFQQALLMQQVMATQQAAARAATVKSAAEMAAARAAEISKQLKGSDEEEEKKPDPPSPRRSKSRSPSRSRSVSRSKSRSPIRYRRGRSPSRSPIRYRRDRAYSPSRARDYFSYRSRGRRGYYRGRGDYYWSPFRRDWDRDRDRDYYPRHRRSRSRSRGRRRSRTRSRSPRNRRERTPSPRRRREERRSMRSTRRSRSRSESRSVSRETKRSISSRSPSASPRRTENSSSPAKKVQESGSDIIHRDDSKSPVRRIGRRDVREISVSPGQVNQIGSPEREERERSLQNDDSFETKSDRDSELPRKAASISPPRSLSVSLNRSMSKDLESDDEKLDVNSKRNKGSTGPLRVEYSDDGEAGHPRTRSISPEDVKPKVSSSDVSSDEIKDGSERNGQFAGRPTRSIKMEERSVKGPEFVAGEDSDEDRGLDDWRDDVKSFSSERIGRRDGKQQHDRQAEERKPIRREFLSSAELDKVRPAQSDTGRDRRKYISGADAKQPLDYDAIQERQRRIDSGKKDLRRQESFRYRDRSPLAEIGKGSDLREIGKHKEDSGEQDEEMLTYPSKKGGAQVIEEVEKQEPSFKAYTVPAGDFDTLEETMRPALVEDYKDEDESDGGVVAAPHTKAKEESDLDDDVKVTLRGSDYGEEDEHTRRKDKEKRSRDRRLDDQEDRKKRKERHKRHRKKHRRDEEDDKDEDDDDGQGRKERRRHKRRHRREDDGSRRDRKRRKHKSHRRGKSASDSAGESPRAEAEDSKDEKDEGPIRKKTSSRHKKRRREPSKSPVISDSSSD